MDNAADLGTGLDGGNVAVMEEHFFGGEETSSALLHCTTVRSCYHMTSEVSIIGDLSAHCTV